MMSGKLEQALQTFDEALKAEPDMSQARFNRGIVLLKLERSAEAATAFGELSQRSSALRAAAAYHRALALDRSGNPAEAERWLETALSAEPGLDSALLYLGVVREKQPQFARAGQAYREFLTRQPESIVAMLRFGICAHRAGYSDTARKYLRQVVSLAPASTEAAEARKFLVMWD